MNMTFKKFEQLCFFSPFFVHKLNVQTVFLFYLNSCCLNSRVGFILHRSNLYLMSSAGTVACNGPYLGYGSGLLKTCTGWCEVTTRV